MKNKLDRLYDFLINHRQYNKELQEKYYKSVLSWHENTASKVCSMLYRVANTQSQPKIDELSKFYRFLHEDMDALGSFNSFVYRISNNSSSTYQNLFEGLRTKNGWGPKTSALFVKSILHIHNNKYDPKLNIWPDAPSSIADNDRIFLPVDTVIIEIFKRLDNQNWSFSSINTLLHSYYSGDQIEVWDDLWFWGFITQKIENNARIVEWNPNKYWSLEYSNKSHESIKQVEQLSKVFLNHLN